MERLCWRKKNCIFPNPSNCIFPNPTILKPTLCLSTHPYIYPYIYPPIHSYSHPFIQPSICPRIQPHITLHCAFTSCIHRTAMQNTVLHCSALSSPYESHMNLIWIPTYLKGPRSFHTMLCWNSPQKLQNILHVPASFCNCIYMGCNRVISIDDQITQCTSSSSSISKTVLFLTREPQHCSAHCPIIHTVQHAIYGTSN